MVSASAIAPGVPLYALGAGALSAPPPKASNIAREEKREADCGEH